MICVDYTDLNKVNLKETYLLSNIDCLVDSTARNELFNFLDVP